MILLTGTSDLIQVTTGSAGAIDAHSSYIDLTGSTTLPGRTNVASIATATTTTLVPSPSSSHYINVKFIAISNEHASVSNNIKVEHTDGTNVETLWQGTLLPGERVICNELGDWTLYTVNGMRKADYGGKLFNQSVTSQGAGFSSDTYLAGSFIQCPVAPKVGTRYRLRIDVSKTGAGTATPIIILRFGTAGTTSDTARVTFTFNASTANADVGTFEIVAVFRTVGSGSSAVLQGNATIVKGLTATTGVVGTVGQSLQVTSAGFDSTVALSGIGASLNAGTSAAWTVQLVSAELENF